MKTLRAECLCWLCVSSSCQTIMGLAMWSLAARRDTIAHCTDHWTGNRADQSHEISQRLMALDLNELIIYKANRQVFQNWDKLDRTNARDEFRSGARTSIIFSRCIIGWLRNTTIYRWFIMFHNRLRFSPNCLIWDHIDYKSRPRLDGKILIETVSSRRSPEHLLKIW